MVEKIKEEPDLDQLYGKYLFIRNVFKGNTQYSDALEDLRGLASSIDESQKLAKLEEDQFQIFAKALILAIDRFDFAFLHTEWLPALTKIYFCIENGYTDYKIMILERIFRVCMLHINEIIVPQKVKTESN